MDNFEQVVTQYTPMIHKIIHSLHIYRNQEELFQTALIGLWEATKGFHAEKGTFSNYAYSTIKGKLLLELKRLSKEEERTLYPKEEYWGTIEDQDATLPLMADELLSYCQGLTAKEALWLKATFLEDWTVKEIAENEHVSISAVKQWKLGAMKKLRARLENQR